MKVVVDASVWVASQIATDVYYSEADRFLEICLTRRTKVVLPEIVLLEVAAAVARLTGDPGAGQVAAKRVEHFPGVSFYPLDKRSLHRALMLATRNYLRAADALYVAAARQAKGVLVTLDDEMLVRGSAVATVKAVSTWIRETTPAARAT